ncbi:uncharacterized protein LOC111364773 [Spodoptera litura]|uniref:Uncharacterized protein LOC111364773 n=1 Tax=Spodoptera litura TaxID=69820 RepID=A0A9J7EXN1_SPOLT|nr:uncharacterized protein LOC111364773 [Spodoptera litura]
MEALTKSVSDLSKTMYARMTALEEEQRKNPSTLDTTQGLSLEFVAFRSFVVQSLTMLQQQVNFLVQSNDTSEMRRRRKILLLHGVPEAKEEVTAKVVVQVAKEHLKLDLKLPDIKRCHRMGRTMQKPRPIIFKLHDVTLRDSIWFGKAGLKGSGLTISEFLTKSRHNVFMAARDKFGVNQCWTKEGDIYILDRQGSRHRVSSLDDLDKIGLPSDAARSASGHPEQRIAQPGSAAGAKEIAPKPKMSKRVTRK